MRKQKERKRSGLSRDGHRDEDVEGARTHESTIFGRWDIFKPPFGARTTDFQEKEALQTERKRGREKEKQSTTDPRKKTRVGCDVSSPSPPPTRSFPTIINPGHRKTRHGKSFFRRSSLSRRNNTLSHRGIDSSSVEERTENSNLRAAVILATIFMAPSGKIKRE